MTIKYLSINEILYIHFFVINEYFFLPDSESTIKGIFDETLLKSAIFSPKHTFDGKDLYHDIFSKAAVLFRSLIKNHPFVDGNKRTAVVATIAFLEKNGYSLTISSPALYRMAMKTAQSKSNDKIMEYLYGIFKKSAKKQKSLFPILKNKIK